MSVVVQKKSQKVIQVGAKNVEYTGPIIKSGIGYNRQHLLNLPRFSGQLYDVGWRVEQGEFDFPTPENPLYMQQLDYTAEFPFATLKHLNKWGTFDRYTDVFGGQDYADPRLMQEHLVGCTFYAADMAAPKDHDALAYNLDYAGMQSWRNAGIIEQYPQLERLHWLVDQQAVALTDLLNQTNSARVATGDNRLGSATVRMYIEYTTNQIRQTTETIANYGGIYISYEGF